MENIQRVKEFLQKTEIVYCQINSDTLCFNIPCAIKNVSANEFNSFWKPLMYNNGGNIICHGPLLYGQPGICTIKQL